MKVRIFSLVLVAVLSLLAFASCGETEEMCEHTFSDTWSSDATNHWHAATCEHGEVKGSLAAHADADEDGKCDVCAYEVGHTHTYASAWSTDETNHWKEATCTHTSEKGENGLHKDENTDGSCDVCEAHVHISDAVGFCKGCDKLLVEIDETDFDRIVEVVASRSSKVINGKVDYYSISRFEDENDNAEMAHIVEYLLGTNGTYSKRSEAEIETIGVRPNATVQKTGRVSVLEKWIKKVSEEEVEGIEAQSVDGVYSYAGPAAYDLDDLAGYYYAVSTFADGYSAEAILMSLYNNSISSGERTVYDLVVTPDLDNNKYTFEYNALVVHKTMVSGEAVYNANYYEVTVSFTYSDDYVLTSLDINCDCYTSDPGADMSGAILEEEIDIDYDPETKTFTMRDGARADNYTISVEQTSGVREEIKLEDGSSFAPTSIKLCEGRNSDTELESLTVVVGGFDSCIYIVPDPVGTFVKFLPNGMDVKVLNKYGRISRSGLMATINNDTIELLPTVAGEYTVQLISGDIVKSVKVVVENETVAGEYKLELVADDNHTFEGNLYNFTVEKTGTYTFYCPSYGVGIWEKTAHDEYADGVGVGPYVDYNNPYNDARSFSIDLLAGEVFSFYYMLAEADVSFTVGYDIAE